MAKNSIKQIEQDERRILYELSKNANKSINDIAKSCKFSRQKVWRSIKKLEKNNTIWGYVAVQDEEKLNKKGFVIVMKRNGTAISKETVEKLKNIDLATRSTKMGIEITESYYIHGCYDWLLCFSANNIIKAKKFVEEIYKLFEGYISEIILLEKMFSTINGGVANPEIKKINDFLMSNKFLNFLQKTYF